MQRHRNPANGFRSNPIGIGGGGPGYRNFNRGGFGRGQPIPPRRIDVFMEAGKLAAEYLVSKGLIPPNLNSGYGKWHSGNLKNQTGGVEGVSDAVSGTGTVTGSGTSSGRRRFSDDGIKGRRTLGSFKNPGGIEVKSEKVQILSDKQGDIDSVSGSIEEQRSGKDTTGVIEDKKSVSVDLDTTTVNQDNPSPDENAGVKTPISDVLNQDRAESEEKSDGKNGNANTDVVMMESEKQIVEEELPEENNEKTANSNQSDLLTLIRFDKIPTRTRSSVSLKGSKTDPVLIAEDKNKIKIQNSGEPEPGNASSLQDNEERKPMIEQVPSEDDQKFKFGQGLCMRSQSFPQRSLISEQELSEGQHGFTRSSSDVLGRGEKRPLQFNNITEISKRQCNSYGEEKQFFPSSFKICDLNLMGGSDANETRNATNSVVGFSSIGQLKQESVSVDFDLTMNSSCDLSNRHMRRGSDGKGVEVIDLDCDSVQDVNNSEHRDEAIFTDLGSFPDSMQRVSGIPQDGYGLMISELLDADIPNSSVPAGVNSMHNDMSLQNDEGILNDDESIYMSLGEIPISMPKL